MKRLGVIPARYASTRFPGKPLADILGKPMIQHVYERCKQSKLLDQVVVATDDTRILKAVESFGGVAVLTAHDHNNGTERCAEVAKIFHSFDYIINIQGDEPLINPAQIDQLCDTFANQPEIVTLVRPIEQKQQIESEHVVKCVRNIQGKALYFSRSTIPFPRNEATTYYQHIGIYAYRADILQQLVTLSPTILEKTESLEQLRWLEHGYSIYTEINHLPSFGVDTPEDIQTIINILQS